MADDTTIQTDQQTDDQAQTDDASGAGDGQNGGQPFISFSSEDDFQAAIDERLKKRLERERAKSEEKAQRAREEAEAKALADQEEWKTLAEKRAAKLADLESNVEQTATELETATQQAERLEKALTAQLAAQKDGLPEATLELLNRLDPVDQLEYLAKHRGSLTANTNGVPPSPAAADETAVSDEQRKTGRDRMAGQIKNWF